MKDILLEKGKLAVNDFLHSISCFVSLVPNSFCCMLTFLDTLLSASAGSLILFILMFCVKKLTDGLFLVDKYLSLINLILQNTSSTQLRTGCLMVDKNILII